MSEKLLVDFCTALAAMKQGKRVTRSIWIGDGVFLFLVQGSKFKVSRAPLNEFFNEGTDITYCPHIDICLANGSIAVWQSNNDAILANDWIVLDA